MALGIALGAVALELGLHHLGGYGWRAVSELSAEFGWLYLPGQDAAFVHDHAIGEHINSWRFRDREWKAPGAVDETGVLRVAAFGTSTTMGSGVRVEQAWPRRLEARLAEELERRGDPRRALVMNFGVPAYTTEQMMRVYERIASRWHPDLVVVAIHPMDLRPMEHAIDEADYPLRSALVRTATYDMLLQHVIGKGHGATGPMTPERRAWEAEYRAMTADPFATGTWPQWVRAAERISAVREQLEAAGGELVLVALPLVERWMPPHWPSPGLVFEGWVERERQAAPGSRVRFLDPTEAFLARQGELTQVIRERGFAPHPRGTKAIDGSYPGWERSLYLTDDFGHFSPRGHAVLADLVFADLLEGGLLDPRD